MFVNSKFFMMKRILIFYLGLLLYSPLFGQNSPHYFKVYPTKVDGLPDWAQLMYSDNPNVHQVIKMYHDYYSTHTFEKNIHTQNFKHWGKLVETMLTDDGFIDQSVEDRLPEEFDKINEKKQSENATRTDPIWNSIGPFNTYQNNGSLNKATAQTNVYCLAVAPSNHDIMYASTEGSALFKSVDHGENWTNTSLDYPISSAADIKVHPTNPSIVYVGQSRTVYKTVDGGLTWQVHYQFPNNTQIEQFYIHPDQPSTVYAATSSGLYKSTDDGTTWVNNFNRRCWDIVPHAINPNTIYLAVNNPDLVRAEIYKSTDNGASWTLKDSLWYMPTDIANAQDKGCKIGVTPADPDRVYAGLIGDSKAGDGGWIGIYYSLNGGDSWVNADGIDGGPYVPGSDPNTNWYVAGYGNAAYDQGWYNFDLDVSHVDPDRLWVGTIWSCESSNRGANILYLRSAPRNLSMHADVQDIDVVGNEIWYTSDGGINYSNDEMQTCRNANSGIHGSTYWGFSQGWNKDIMTGGRYHNGNAAYHENYGTGETIFLGGAEAPTGYVNPLHNNRMYFSDISARNIGDSLNVGSTNISSLAMLPNESYFPDQKSEIVYYPSYANHFYLGSDSSIYRSTNGGVSFDKLFSFDSSSRTLELEISRSNPLVIYCVVKYNNVSKLFKSVDGGLSFSPTTALPVNNIQHLNITLDPEDENNLWASSNTSTNGQKVYQTLDGGQTWINRTTSILDGHKISEMVYQGGTNNLVYIMTDNAAFYWDQNASNWVDYSEGLPNRVRTIVAVPFYRDSKLRYASSHGIMEAPFVADSRPIAQPMTESPLVNCTKDTILFDDYSILNHENATWNWNFNPQPAYVSSTTARNPKVVFGQNGTFDVTLTVTDGNGNSSTKTVENMITVDSKCEPDSIPGSAIRMHGPADFVQLPNMGLEPTNTLTISAWIKPKGIQNDKSGIVMNDDIPGAGFNFMTNNRLGYHWPGGSWNFATDLSVDTNRWSHVAMVVSPSNVTIYINGVPKVHTANIQLGTITSMKIGRYQETNTRNFVGDIDEVCIWNRSLTQNEIRELRHLTRTGINPFTDSLIAYYQFNEQINYALDKIGVKHGTLRGNSEKVISTAPVGGGESYRTTITAPGTVNLGATEMQLTFGANHPNGEIVATRLHLLPDSIPSLNPNSENYWIVNNYGTVDFDALASLKLDPAFASANGAASNCMLYTRTDNEHINNWTEECSAVHLNGGTYNFDAACGLTNFSQFFVQSIDTSEIWLGNDEVLLGETISIAPNPTAGKVTIAAHQDIQLMEVLDQLGKRIKIVYEVGANEEVTLDLSNFASGLYTVVIHTNNQLIKARILKQ